MSAATISPQQRQRILHAHYLRQAGATTQNIAANLEADPAAIQADLRLLEQHWHDITRQAANDALLSSLAALQFALAATLQTQPDGSYRYASQLNDLLPLCRELRQTANQIHKHSLFDNPNRPEPALDYPDDQLAAPEPDRTQSNTIEQDRTQSNTIEQDRTQSNTAEQDRTTSNTPTPPRPDRNPAPNPKNTPETENSQISPELYAEAVKFLEENADFLAGPPPPMPPEAIAAAKLLPFDHLFT